MTETYGWGDYWGSMPWGGRAAVVNTAAASSTTRTVTVTTPDRTVTIHDQE